MNSDDHIPIGTADATLRIGERTPDRPILIAGPTASGKSGLALNLARQTGRAIVNADALQVFDGWRLLTARPGPDELAAVPHFLYGHVPPDRAYSVGEWLRDLQPTLDQSPAPIIVGGTGLYLSALTEGLADIPATLPETRNLATARLAAQGVEAMAAELDTVTQGRIDLRNPMRVQRAWEVQHQTGRSISDWQDGTPPPLLPLAQTFAFVLNADRDWLAQRIARRIDAMFAAGLLEEAQCMRRYQQPGSLSFQAIGAVELMQHLDGILSLENTRTAINLATRQYAKRQRTWFRNRMKDWIQLNAAQIVPV